MYNFSASLMEMHNNNYNRISNRGGSDGDDNVHNDDDDDVNTVVGDETVVDDDDDDVETGAGVVATSTTDIAAQADDDEGDCDQNSNDNNNNSDTEALPRKRGMRQRKSSIRRWEVLVVQVVQWIQQWKLPKRGTVKHQQQQQHGQTNATMIPRISASISNNNNNNNMDDHKYYDNDDDDAIPIIAGLDRVVFGTAAASEVVLICGMKPPQYLWYMLSGGICDVLQLFLDMMLYMIFHIEDASLCWALGFAVSVFFRHTSHRYLVFGNYVGGYTKSLIRMYTGYSIIIVLSTLFNFFMIRLANISHYAAWIITLLWTGIVNYFILKKLWSFGGNKNITKTTTSIKTNSRGRTYSSGADNTVLPVRGRTASSGSAASMTSPQQRRERTFSSTTTATTLSNITTNTTTTTALTDDGKKK